MKFPRAYDATVTRSDFIRLLGQATGDAEWRESGGRFVGRGWAVRLTPIAPLAIGRVHLDRHRVEVELHGMTPEDEEAFMNRFTLHYQRGGG